MCVVSFVIKVCFRNLYSDTSLIISNRKINIFMEKYISKYKSFKHVSGIYKC